MHILRSRARPATGRRATLVGRHALVLDAYGDFGHAVLDGEVWIIRHPSNVLRAGDVIRVVEQQLDLLVVREADS